MKYEVYNYCAIILSKHTYVAMYVLMLKMLSYMCSFTYVYRHLHIYIYASRVGCGASSGGGGIFSLLSSVSYVIISLTYVG